MNIEELIQQLQAFKQEGYTEVGLIVSDKDDNFNAENLYLNEGVLIDGTRVLELELTLEY
jgi:hypothetical protein